MTKDVAERLLDIKKQIDDSKLEKARIKGALDQNLKRLKDDFGCSTVKQGKKKLEELEEEQEKVKKKLDKAVEKLEEAYEWE